MKNVKFIYLYFLSGVLFLITAGAFNSLENSNLTPVFASLGFTMMSIGFALYSRSSSCKTKKKDSE